MKKLLQKIKSDFSPHPEQQIESPTMIDDALRQIKRFRGSSLAQTIASIETRLIRATNKDAMAVNTAVHVDKSLIASHLLARWKRVRPKEDLLSGLLQTNS